MNDMPVDKPQESVDETDHLPFDAGDQKLSPTDTFVVNYFNYFTEVEEHFVRRRGKHLYVSSLDWAIIESWKDMGIPLHIVLRGIDRVFDAYDANHRPNSGRLINSILYCQQEVLSCFEDYKHARVGATPESPASSDLAAMPAAAPSPFSKEMILEYLNSRRDLLERFAGSLDPNSAMVSMQETIGRATTRLDEIVRDAQSAHTLDLETLEQELSRIEAMIYETLLPCVPPGQLEDVREEGKRQLREYKKRMTPEIYQQTLDHYVAKRLREDYQIPRLSLFYL
ncbi:MAG: hypothetical protein HY314_06295 [Acidobacteria bacterium]|nr:hypothetical protein [Acidobacteriota bacterium]